MLRPLELLFFLDKILLQFFIHLSQELNKFLN